jgi:thioredoxin-like negative regulator of GroEL
MGLKDFFSSEGRAARSIQKHVNRARNKDAQHVDRQASLDVLRDAAVSDAGGSDDAIAGLLGRFTIRYDKSIEDEQEKEFVAEELIHLGTKVLPELKKHLRSADSIAYGLKVLHAVADKDAAWPILEDLCERNDNTYTRDPSKKIQLLNYLGEQEDPRCCKALLPYLEDMDEGVRFTAVEALVHHKDPEVAREPLCKLLTNEKEESRRIKKRILDGFSELGWDVKGFSGTVEKMLPDMLPGARLDNHGKIRRKQA